MEYNYREIIDALNSGEITEIIFSVKNYNHYNNCHIKRVSEALRNGNELVWIAVQLTKDNSELTSFYKTFDERYKLFRIRNQKFTLEQIWESIQIAKIVYSND